MINNKTGIITTIAGNGSLGFSGDGGPATAAELDDPWGVAVDDSGNVYISDAENGRIRKVNASTGIINTLISTIAPGSLVLDSAKNLYFVNHIKSIVNKLNYQTKAITTIAGSGTKGIMVVMELRQPVLNWVLFLALHLTSMAIFILPILVIIILERLI